MRKNYLVIAIGLCALATFPASPLLAFGSYGSGEEAASALNPNNDSARTQSTSIDRVIFRITQPEPVSSGPVDSAEMRHWENEGFRAPSVYVTNLFNTNNDKRPAGLDSFQYRLQVGGDFVTYADFVVGALYTYGFEDGEVDDATIPPQKLDYDKISHHLTLYTGRSFGDWFVAGATMTLGWSDLDSKIPAFAVQNGQDLFSYAPSVYAGVAHSWDHFGFSSVVAYQYEEIYYDPAEAGDGFNTSTGTVTWKTAGTWHAADWVDWSVFYKLTQIAHTNVQIPLPAGESNDHNWSTIGTKAVFYPAAHWEIEAGIEYDVFNRNYEENVTGQLGCAYKF